MEVYLEPCQQKVVDFFPGVFRGFVLVSALQVVDFGCGAASVFFEAVAKLWSYFWRAAGSPKSFKCLVHQMNFFFATTFVRMNLQCSSFESQLYLFTTGILIHQHIVQRLLGHQDFASLPAKPLTVAGTSTSARGFIINVIINQNVTCSDMKHDK